MTIKVIKDLVKSNFNKNLLFRYNGTRNHTEVFQGRITEIYPSIFIITLKDEKIKSFSYNDLLVSNLEIINQKVKNLAFSFILL